MGRRSEIQATHRRRAAAAKRGILVKLIQLESLLASFNFLKVSSFSDTDGVEFQRLTPRECLMQHFFPEMTLTRGHVLVIQLGLLKKLHGSFNHRSASLYI